MCSDVPFFALRATQGRQGSEVRGQRSEVRDQKAEIRGSGFRGSGFRV